MTNVHRLVAEYELAWQQVRPNLAMAQVAAAHLLTAPLTVTDVDRIRKKGERGYLEHRGGIIRMTSDEVLVEARAECDDLLWYLGWNLR